MIDVTQYVASSHQSKVEDQNTLMHVHSTIYREKQSVHNDPFVSHRLRTARFPCPFFRRLSYYAWEGFKSTPPGVGGTLSFHAADSEKYIFR